MRRRLDPRIEALQARNRERRDAVSAARATLAKAVAALRKRHPLELAAIAEQLEAARVALEDEILALGRRKRRGNGHSPAPTEAA